MVPLSPPTSPRMLDMSRSEADGQKRFLHASYGLHDTCYRDEYPSQPMHHESSDGFANESHRQSLRPYRPFPHFQGTSVGPNLQTHGLNMTPESHVSSRDYPFPQLIQPTVTGVSMSAKSADSAPPSPADRLTPRSAEQSVKADDDDEEMVDSGGEDEDDALDKVNMTPAEIRAQKRKMKRHRFASTMLKHHQAIVLTLPQTYTHADSLLGERICSSGSP